MFLSDYHVHSKIYSPDAVDSMADMAGAAEKRGIVQLCFTNHVESCSAGDPLPSGFPPFKDWDRQQREYDAVRRAMDGRLDVRLGAEVGSPNHCPGVAEDIYKNKKLDFIIGSIHNLRGMDDFYFLRYGSAQECRGLTERYLGEYMEIARMGCCDVLGHIGYMQKYMVRQGVRIDMMEYAPQLRELFSLIIPRGIGIEVNTSGLRDALGALIPDRRVLALYRECGGRIITAGSDSHMSADAGAGIAEAFGVLRSLGFDSVATYREHRPEFIKI